MAIIERKYLAHFLDSSMGGTVPAWARLGKDLEELNEELNPQVEIKKNILGEQTSHHTGYEVQTSVEPYYADNDDPLYPALEEIALNRKTGKDCMTKKIDLCIDEKGDVIWAWMEDVMLVPTQLGGDTSGYQIPFTIYNCGNRKRCF